MLRTSLISSSLLIFFVTTVVLLTRTMPQPLRSLDYLLIGGAATMLCLGALFCVLMATSLREQVVFFRRKAASESSGQ